jgi:tRNA 2-selenouridine synthase
MTGRSPLPEQQLSKKVLLYCFRGGMRSNSFAFLLETAGFEVGLLKGGYKAFRAHIHESFTRAQSIVVLGGMTGSGKTEMLHRLSERGMQVIDLEGLARHKGSVFGGIGQQTQPSSEHFENLLFDQWRWQNPEQPLVLEDENMDIGGVKLPQTIWRRIRSAPLVVLDVPFETRVQRLVREYAGSNDELNVAIRRIERRLGNLRMNQALQAVADGDRAAAARILLAYYDESYEAGIMKRKAGTVVRVDASGDVLSELIRQIIKLSCPGIHAGE